MVSGNQQFSPEGPPLPPASPHSPIDLLFTVGIHLPDACTESPHIAKVFILPQSHLLLVERQNVPPEQYSLRGRECRCHLVLHLLHLESPPLLVSESFCHGPCHAMPCHGVPGAVNCAPSLQEAAAYMGEAVKIHTLQRILWNLRFFQVQSQKRSTTLPSL